MPQLAHDPVENQPSKGGRDKRDQPCRVHRKTPAEISSPGRSYPIAYPIYSSRAMVKLNGCPRVRPTGGGVPTRTACCEDTPRATAS